MPWQTLSDTTQLDAIAQASASRPQLLFKHSTRCSISSVALKRMEQGLPQLSAVADCYYLDLLAHRDVSNAIAEKFAVHHESPQALLIVDGECILAESHMDIQPAELLAQIQQAVK